MYMVPDQLQAYRTSNREGTPLQAGRTQEKVFRSSRKKRDKVLIPPAFIKMHPPLGPVSPSTVGFLRGAFSFLCSQGDSEHRFIPLRSANACSPSSSQNLASNSTKATLLAPESIAVLGLRSEEKAAAYCLLISGLCGPRPRTSPLVPTSLHTCL